MKFIKLITPQGVEREVPEADKQRLLDKGFTEPKNAEPKPKKESSKK